VSLSSPAWDAVDPVFEEFRERWGIPGVSFGVVAGGKLVHAGGIGTFDLSAPAPPGPETVFRIASMTKSFTAACVLLLRDEGRLRLDDLVADYVPAAAGLRYPTTDSAPLTVRALLTMSSGLVEDDPWADRQLAATGEALDAMLAGGVTFDRVPGTAYEYSNLGYAVLGRIVAEAAGIPLRELAATRLFAPLGMTDTTWDADRVPAGARAMGYSRVRASDGAGGAGAARDGAGQGRSAAEGQWVAEPPLADGAFGAMGGLATSVRDLATWVALHLSAWPPRDDPDDGPLRRASLREMATPHTAGPTFLATATGEGGLRRDGYGYGLVAGFHSRDGRVVGHSGGLPGFSSHMEWLPDLGVGVVALANRTYVPARTAVRQAFDALAAAGALPQPAPPAVSEALLAARETVDRLYERWDDGVAGNAMLDTYFLDRDVKRRPPDFPRLRARYGPVISTGPVSPEGALRGSWTLTCERGALDVAVMLGPTLPTRIQWLRVTPVG